MILPETKAEIRRLVLADGWKIETVARRFGVHHSVVRRATRTAPASVRASMPPPSALEPFKPYVVQRLSELPELTAVRLLLELRLGLPHAASELDDAAKKAIARNEKPLSLLDHLMRDELRVRIELRARAALKRSMIFPVTTLDTYDFDFPKQIDKSAVSKAASLDFVRDKTNVVFVGPSGVGKTHLANAIGLVAATRGYRVRFVTAADLVNDLVARQARNTLHRALHQWASYDLLLCDELGYLSFDARGADLLYQVFNKRYQRASTIAWDAALGGANKGVSASATPKFSSMPMTPMPWGFRPRSRIPNVHGSIPPYTGAMM